VPVYVAGTTDAVEVGAGDSFSCFRKSDDTVWCWGRDDRGQLGDLVNAPNDTQPTPRQVIGIDSPPLQLAVGGSHACVRLDSGEVKCWGSNQNCVLGINPTYFGWKDFAWPAESLALYNPIRIAVGGNLTCAWTQNGGFLCIGDKNALGSTSANACEYNPVEVNGFHFGSPAPAAVALGRTANCGLESDGSVRCWTSAGYDTYTPNATSIAASNDYFCALDGTGASTCYLGNMYGEHGAPGGYTSSGRSTIGFGGY
jgi:alpha-tubulin suppressor-like RCC1 family protein